ncbi:MAG: enoyl-CoA hydratase/isomerase family protein, partial [Chloroflexi bacterium]|nr:enoyl-CoA hydratase/isomerase family protein [Chloroflexota bacterium]
MKSVSYENIVVTRDEGVGTIRLNRPKVLNALSRSLYREVDTAIGELEADDEIKVLVFTGT